MAYKLIYPEGYLKRAKKFLQKHCIRENASIDWTRKESVRSKLKVVVKRLLRNYGYPPDMQLLAT